MRYALDAEQLETRTVAEWIKRDGLQFGAKQAAVGEAVAHAICGPSWASERELKIAELLAAAEHNAVREALLVSAHEILVGYRVRGGK